MSSEFRNLLGSALALLLLCMAFYFSFTALGRAQTMVDRRSKLNQSLRVLNEELSQIREAETGQRGFLLTGDAAQLSLYDHGRIQAMSNLDRLPELYGFQALSAQDLAELRAKTLEKLEELARTLKLARAGRREEAMALVKGGAGFQLMDEIQALHESLAGNLQQMRNAQDLEVTSSAHRARLILGSAGFLALLILTLNAWLLHRGSRLRGISERRFRMLAESAPVGIYEFDFERETVYANEAHRRLTGVPREEATRERFQASVHPEDRPWVLERVEAAMRDGLAFDQPYRLKHDDGTVLWVHSRGTPIKDTPGHAVGYLIISQDITAMRTAEAEIHAKAEALQSANKELEAFAYSVSHDLRAPLRHIDGFVGLLRRSLGETVDDRAKHQLDVISASARQMGALIDDLLTFSRMGRAEVHKTNFDLGTLLRRVIDELAPDTADRNIEWRLGDLPGVHGDPTLLRLVLLNLIGNALKFTRGRAPACIEISASTSDGATLITIRDNGAGFDMRYADKLFGVFQRLHRQEEFEGTGIGLANVARIIHKHGGGVSAEGTVNIGATFTFTLPNPEVL